jgi:hypothetical protein
MDLKNLRFELLHHLARRGEDVLSMIQEGVESNDSPYSPLSSRTDNKVAPVWDDPLHIFEHECPALRASYEEDKSWSYFKSLDILDEMFEEANVDRTTPFLVGEMFDKECMTEDPSVYIFCQYSYKMRGSASFEVLYRDDPRSDHITKIVEDLSKAKDLFRSYVLESSLSLSRKERKRLLRLYS